MHLLELLCFQLLDWQGKIWTSRCLADETVYMHLFWSLLEEHCKVFSTSNAGLFPLPSYSTGRRTVFLFPGSFKQFSLTYTASTNRKLLFSPLTLIIKCIKVYNCWKLRISYYRFIQHIFDAQSTVRYSYHTEHMLIQKAHR